MMKNRTNASNNEDKKADAWFCDKLKKAQQSKPSTGSSAHHIKMANNNHQQQHRRGSENTSNYKMGGTTKLN